MLLGEAGGTFGPPTDLAVGASPGKPALGDFNGDPDLAVPATLSNTVSVLLGQAGGGFASRTEHATGAGPSMAAVGDDRVHGNAGDDQCFGGPGTDEVRCDRRRAGPASAARDSLAKVTWTMTVRALPIDP